MNRNRITRRRLLGLGASGAAALGLGRLGPVNALAQSAGDYKALVCVFLFGGNDSDNMIVPVSSQSDRYAAVRGDLAVPRSEMLSMQAAGEEGRAHGKASGDREGGTGTLRKTGSAYQACARAGGAGRLTATSVART